MIRAQFDSEMLEILKETVGKRFVSYECGTGEEKWNRTYGNLRLNFEDFAVDLLNEEKPFQTPYGVDDFACFSCTKMKHSCAFHPYVNEPTKVHPINETITKVEIFQDTIRKKQMDFEFCCDTAILFHMPTRTIMFSRRGVCDEGIYIASASDFDKIYPISKVVEDWEMGEIPVSVERNRTVLGEVVK